MSNEPSCMDCGLSYYKFGLDSVLPHDQWKLINPDNDGLLCANCIVMRAAKLGSVVSVRMDLFAWMDEGTPSADTARLVRAAVEATREEAVEISEDYAERWRLAGDELMSKDHQVVSNYICALDVDVIVQRVMSGEQKQ